jgi:hypothetical protein
MQMSSQRSRRQSAIQRVLEYIQQNPHCDARQICAALAIPFTTLNGYTMALRQTGRIVKTPHRRGLRCNGGSAPDTFHASPPGAPADPAKAPPTRRRAALPPRTEVVAKRMDLVAALFGPARKVSS